MHWQLFNHWLTSAQLQNIPNQQAAQYVASLGVIGRRPMASLFPQVWLVPVSKWPVCVDVFPIAKAPPLLTDLLDALLVFNPSRRISAAQALVHPFLVNADFRDAEMEGLVRCGNALIGTHTCYCSQRMRTPCSTLTLNFSIPLRARIAVRFAVLWCAVSLFDAFAELILQEVQRMKLDLSQDVVDMDMDDE